MIPSVEKVHSYEICILVITETVDIVRSQVLVKVWLGDHFTLPDEDNN